jgi:hypothetical protein
MKSLKRGDRMFISRSHHQRLDESDQHPDHGGIWTPQARPGTIVS